MLHILWVTTFFTSPSLPECTPEHDISSVLRKSESGQDVPSDKALTQVLQRRGLDDQELDLILHGQHHILFEIST